jgi:hypothetical protein
MSNALLSKSRRIWARALHTRRLTPTGFRILTGQERVEWPDRFSQKLRPSVCKTRIDGDKEDAKAIEDAMSHGQLARYSEFRARLGLDACE